jgi:hypothetical protein
MPLPRFSEEDLWTRVRQLHRTRAPFTSVVRRHRYTIADVDDSTRSYMVRYRSGNTKSIPISDLFAFYKELYRLGRLPRGYIRAYGRRIIGHNRYSHAPGATIYAILPKLDDAIRVEEGGHLSIHKAA